MFGHHSNPDATQVEIVKPLLDVIVLRKAGNILLKKRPYFMGALGHCDERR